MDRLNTVRDYLKSGSVVCHFARAYAEGIIYTQVRDNIPTEDVRGPILQFVEGDGYALTFIFESDPPHKQARERAVETFIRLSRILFLDHLRGTLEDWATNVNEIRKCFSPTSKLNPFLVSRSGPLFSIAMGPQYQERHPRYAPHSILVVTRHSDVSTVEDIDVQKIRERITERMGSLYDADELYLSD